MRTKLFTGLAALSLMLVVAFAVLAVRSYWEGHALFWLRHDDERFIERVADVRLVNGGEIRLLTRHTQHFERATHDQFKGWVVREPGWGHAAMPPDDRAPFDAGEWSSSVFGEAEWEVLGVGYNRQIWDAGPNRLQWEREIILPAWLLLLLGLVLPALWLRGWWRRRFARRPGLCSRCGYDLRSTPGRCPECGAPAATAPGKGGSSEPGRVGPGRITPRVGGGSGVRKHPAAASTPL